LIQIRGKIVVHFLNKGGGYLGEALHEEERGREWPTLQIAAGGDFLEREKRRGEEKEKERKRKASAETV
jgi:hypothetical protein